MSHDHGMGILCMRFRFYLQHNPCLVRPTLVLCEARYCSHSVALLIVPVKAVFSQETGTIQSDLVIRKQPNEGHRYSE